jgi:4-amino-4-deoxy-L-arabinose transferase-like glycosyltransferase
VSIINKAYKNQYMHKNKILFIFLSTHLFIWTLVPSIVNNNLPLDVIESLAWGSNLEWGFSKHPPMMSFSTEFFYQIFGNQDWAYYLLSQIFVVASFYIIYKLAEDMLKNKYFALLSIFLLEGIYFYNFTTPEFNVNVCQLPFWSLAVLYTWKCIKKDKFKDYLLLGIFVSLGVLSKYLFVYLILSITILFICITFREKRLRIKLLTVIPVFLLILLPHLIWLVKNDYITIFYGLHRTGDSSSIWDHIIYPVIFLGKQIGILIPFFLMIFFLFSKYKASFNFKDQKILFLLIINLVPITLMFLTSVIMGVKIRTMWMTPFYLFFGVLIVYIFQSKIDLKKLNNFYYIFGFLFIFSPLAYASISIAKTDKRTDYNGKQKAKMIQLEWNRLYQNKKIYYVWGNEWEAGNLSYHLKDRPKWMLKLKENIRLEKKICIMDGLCVGSK